MNNTRQPLTTGLVIPKGMGVGESVEREIHSNWSTLEAIERDVAMRGLRSALQPQHPCPQLTADMLTTADSTAYSTNYAMVLSWFQYTADMVAHVRAKELEIENERAMIGAKMRKKFRTDIASGGGKMTTTEMEDIILTDPRNEELLLEEQRMKQYKIILSTHMENIERALKVISRQVEIRKSDFENGRVNIPNRGYQVRRPNE